MAKENCIVCNKETTYDFDTHVDMRYGYIEGAGQLCIECYNKGTDHGAVLVDYSTILGTPNDQDLGEKVRTSYWNQKNK